MRSTSTEVKHTQALQKKNGANTNLKKEREADRTIQRRLVTKIGIPIADLIYSERK